MIEAGVVGLVLYGLVLVLAWGLIENRLLGRRQVERVVDDAVEARAG